MSTNQTASLESHLGSARELFAQLLMLMMQSVQEDPAAQQAGDDIDTTIRGVMGRIDEHMDLLRTEVESLRVRGQMTPDRELDVRLFNEQIGEGLRMMQGTLQRRRQSLEEQHENVRNSLKTHQRKRKGHMGYQARPGGSHFIESDH